MENTVRGGVAQAQRVADGGGDIAQCGHRPWPIAGCGYDERGLDGYGQAAHDDQANDEPAPADGRLHDVATPVGEQYCQQPTDDDHAKGMG